MVNNRRTFARYRIDHQAAAMQLRNPFTERQPQPCAALRPRTGLVRLIIRFKRTRRLFSRHAAAAVNYVKAVLPHVHTYRRLSARTLRIDNEVAQKLNR